MTRLPEDGFRIDSIPIGGIAGALVGVGGIAILVLGVPPLRWAVLLAVIGGGLFAAVLWLWHRH
jgi:hypothetical protein